MYGSAHKSRTHCCSLRGCQLIRFLRPELVAKSPFPLSSDAFSGWGRIGKEEHEQVCPLTLKSRCASLTI